MLRSLYILSANTRSCFYSTSLKNNWTMVKKALVFLAEGAEEMETVITVDTLRRAGIDLTLAGVSGDQAVLCSRNVKVLPDVSLTSVASLEFDAVIVPGGLKGAEECATVMIVFILNLNLIILILRFSFTFISKEPTSWKCSETTF